MNKFKILFYGTVLSIAYISCDNANTSSQYDNPEIDGTALVIDKETPQVDGVLSVTHKALLSLHSFILPFIQSGSAYLV